MIAAKFITSDQDTIWVMTLISVIATFIALILLIALFLVYNKEPAKGPFIGIQVTVLLLLILSITLLFDNVLDNIEKVDPNKKQLNQLSQGHRSIAIDLKQIRLNNIITAILQMIAGVLCLISFGFIKHQRTSQTFIFFMFALLFSTIVVNGFTMSKYFIRVHPK